MSDDAPRFGHEYEYTALRPIPVGGVLAYNPGDGVPAANVKEQGYQVGVDVARAGTAKEADMLPADPASLKGQALEDALDGAGLPKDGTADEKRQRLAGHQSGQPA